MADIQSQLPVKLVGPNAGTNEAQITSTAGGALQVEIVNLSGSPGEVTTQAEYTEDSIHTTADVGIFVLSVRNDTLATLVDTDGDYAPFQVNADGALYVDVSNTGDISVVVNYEYAEDSIHTTGDVGAFVLAVRNDAGTPLAADGDYIPISTDSSGSLRVTGGTNSEFAEDSIHTSGDIGNFVLAVRNDTLASLVTTDGDYAPFQVNADGALYVDVSNTGDISVVTNYEYAEDSIHTTGDVGAFVLAVRNDAGTPLAADGDYIPLSTDSSGNLRVNATIDTTFDYPEDSVHTSGDVGAFVLAVRNDVLASLVTTDGDYAPFQVDANGALYVTIDGAIKIDDSPFTVGTDSVMANGYLFDDTATDSVDEDDIGIARMTADRKQLVRIAGNTDANRVNVDDNQHMLTDRIEDTDVVHTYATVASVGNNSSGTITHTVPDGTTFYLKQIIAASSGGLGKVDISYDDGTVTSLATVFYASSRPFADITFDQPVPIVGVVGGTDVDVVITNRAGQAQDVYATIMGRDADIS